VFVLVANALDTMPANWRMRPQSSAARLDTGAARDDPARAAGAGGGALIAFLQAMTLFGSPAILALPAGFHTMTPRSGACSSIRRSSNSRPPPRCRCCS